MWAKGTALFLMKVNEAARANKAKVAAATKADERVPRKRTGGGLDRGAPKQGRTDKYCKLISAVPPMAVALGIILIEVLFLKKLMIQAIMTLR